MDTSKIDSTMSPRLPPVILGFHANPSATRGGANFGFLIEFFLMVVFAPVVETIFQTLLLVVVSSFVRNANWRSSCLFTQPIF